MGSSDPPFSAMVDDAILHVDSIIARLKEASFKQSTTLPSPPLEDSGKCGNVKELAFNVAPSQIQKNYMLGSETESVKAEQRPLSSSSQVSGSCDAEKVDLFDKAHIQVGLVLSVEDHPVAEKLYVCKVEVANKEQRQVVAGLRKFIAKSELLGKKVCVILNLKPAKLAGQVSEAMILAGDFHSTDTQEVVKILEPPSNSSIGDRIYLQGFTASCNPAKQLSSKVWEKIVPLLKVKGGFATFDGNLVVTNAGAVKVDGLPDGSGIH